MKLGIVIARAVKRITKYIKLRYPTKNAKNKSTVTSEELVEFFIAEMNTKAKNIGMVNTNCKNPHGLYDASQVITAEDAVKMGVAAINNSDLRNIWSAKSREINVTGENARTFTVDTTVAGSALEDHYTLIGGKTGNNRGVTSNLLALVDAPGDKWFLGAILQADSDRFAETKDLFDIATLYLDPEHSNGEDVAAKKAAVCLLDSANPVYDGMLWSKNETTANSPASVIKVLTALLVLDYVTDLSATMTVIDVDIQRGAGPVFYAGDVISIEDALYCMMLPSSNTMAMTVARYIARVYL